jgi:hypothetical protein
MGVTDAAVDGSLVKVQAGKIARIGSVAKAQVNTVGSVVDSGFQGRQAASRANQFHGYNSRLRRWRAGVVRNGIHHALGLNHS